MRALVIGGTGPTGPYIVQGLVKRGYEPVILHRGTHETDLGVDVEHIHADPHFAETLSSGVAGRRFDLVIATYGRLRLFVDALEGITDRLVTVGGTAYRDLAGRPATEDSERYVENKIVSKIVQTEELLRRAHEEGRYNITHLRYPNLYGPRQLGPREWSIIRRIQDGRRTIPVLNGGLSLESRAYVENAAHAVLLAVDLPERSAGQQYNVADEYTPPDAVRVHAIAAQLGVEVTLASFPDDAGAPAYWWGNGRDLDFVRERRAPSTHHKLISIEKVKNELGYRDPVGFDEAIRRTVRWYLDHPLERGGEEESQIGDPFDYVAEDAYLAALRNLVRETAEIPFSGVTYAHPYAHPTTPNTEPARHSPTEARP
jgi:nucleoside-diphosphate-sugar epimerase